MARGQLQRSVFGRLTAEVERCKLYEAQNIIIADGVFEVYSEMMAIGKDGLPTILSELPNFRIKVMIQ